jgi:CRISPR-associated endonuclease/helicase Cas3
MKSELVLTGLDGSNPLAFLAALGTMRSLTLASPACEVKMAWAMQSGIWSPVIHLQESVDEVGLISILFDHLEQDIRKHPAAFLENMHGADEADVRRLFRDRAGAAQPSDRNDLEWLSAMSSDVATEATSQLQTARRDYFFGNMKSVMSLTTSEHLERTLFRPWDYGDPLENQSLHLEPSEDRRHAHQWHKPSGDPTRKKRGGMLGANRLAIEAIPLFQSIAMHEKLATRGFFGNRAGNTRWTWPVWSCSISIDVIATLLGMENLQSEQLDARALRAQGIVLAFRSRRILVGKTPNFTPAQPV